MNKPLNWSDPPLKGDYRRNFDLLLRLITKTKIPLDYTTMVLELADDRSEDRVTYLGLRRAPAAKQNHHAFEGGLVFHLLEMWDIWEKWSKVFQEIVVPDLLDDRRVLQAILLHDIEKADRCYVVRSRDPWETYYGASNFHKLLSSGDLRSIAIASRHGITLDEVQLNALMWAHGGFSDIQNSACTTLAKVVYLLDEWSGNVLGRVALNDSLGLIPARPRK